MLPELIIFGYMPLFIFKKIKKNLMVLYRLLTKKTSNHFINP